MSVLDPHVDLNAEIAELRRALEPSRWQLRAEQAAALLRSLWDAVVALLISPVWRVLRHAGRSTAAHARHAAQRHSASRLRLWLSALSLSLVLRLELSTTDTCSDQGDR